MKGLTGRVAPVVVTDDLIRLRQDVISLLQLMFHEIQEPHRRIEVVKVLNCATEYPSQGRYSEGMQEMIQDNTKTLFDFYLALASRTPPPEVEVLEEIEKQAHRLKVWHEEDIEVIDPLLSVLQSNEWYQLYRTLLSGNPLLCSNERESSEQVQTEIDEKIKGIADAITDENLSEWLEKLNGIAETSSEKSDQDFPPFYQLLSKIGEDKPHIAQALIDSSLREDNALKEFVAKFIRGIRASTRSDIAGNYINGWLSGEDQMLILEIPETYWRVDEKFLDAKDVEIFDTLLNCRMKDKNKGQELDRRIMSNIKWIYKKNPEKIVEIICQLFERADQDTISHYMHELRWERKQIDLSQWDLEVFEKIFQKFVDIPALNKDAIYILAQYGQKAPLRLIEFFECRVEKQKQTERSSFSDETYYMISRRYEAIPHFLKEIAEMYQAHPQYSEVINQIMGWFQKNDYHYKQAAADLISGISPQLDGLLKETLLNLIRSGGAENILAVLKVLEKFPEDSVSDELCKEAVKHSEGETKLQKSIEDMIVNRIRVHRGIGGGVITFQNLKEKLSSWLEDENQYVRDCARRIIRRLEHRIEYEEQHAAEEEIKRKKGIL